MVFHYYDIFNEPIISKKMGAPLKYEPQYDTEGNRIKTATLTYKKRGFIISKIKVLKKKYNMDYPAPEEYRRRPETELLKLLEKMNFDVLALKNTVFEKKINELNQAHKLIC